MLEDLDMVTWLLSEVGVGKIELPSLDLSSVGTYNILAWLGVASPVA